MLRASNNFHESYFLHGCRVTTEKDVLYTAIRGRGCRAALLRWWHDWFLLSYSDERGRIYYTSSQALRLDRARHFRQYRSRIHPLSKFSTLWSAIMFGVTISNRVLFHQNTALLYGTHPATAIVLGVILEIVTLLDIIINFKTGYTDKLARRIVLNAWAGRVNYCSTKLFLHVLSTLPLQCILMLRYGVTDCIFCKTNKFVCTLKLFSIFGLIRAYEASLYLTRERSTFGVTYTFRFIRIFILGFVTMLQVMNFFGAVYILLVITKQELPATSIFTDVVKVKVSFNDTGTDIRFLTLEFAHICKGIFHFGYGFYKYGDTFDMLVGMSTEIIGSIFCMWGFIEAFTILEQKLSDDKFATHKDRTINWMRFLQLSDKISGKVHAYYDHHMTRIKVIEKENFLYELLPSILKNEVKWSTYYSFLRRIPCFSEWPIELVEGLVLLLTEDVYLERDIVVDTFAQGEGLMILYTGVLGVYDGQQRECGHLIDGDYFGELSLVTDQEVRTSRVMAVTVCKVLHLHKKLFRKYMQKHPRFFFCLRTALWAKYSNTAGRVAINVP